jgi:hypothetical protein
LDNVRPESDKAGATYPARGRINDPVAISLRTKASSEFLTGRVSNAGIAVKDWFGGSINGEKIMEHAIEIGDQFCVIRGVLEAPYRLKLASEMVGYLVNCGLDFERAIPCTSVLGVETVTARPRVGESSVYEGKAGATKHELPRIQIQEAVFLRFQPCVGHALQPREVLKRFVVGSER